MYKLSIVTYPDKDQDDLPMEYSSPVHALAAFKETFDTLETCWKNRSPELVLSYNGREIHKEFKPVHRELDTLRVFQTISGAL
jgi:hypothetical protein